MATVAPDFTEPIAKENPMGLLMANPAHKWACGSTALRTAIRPRGPGYVEDNFIDLKEVACGP